MFASLPEDLKLSVSFSEGPQHGPTLSSDTLDIPYLPHTLILWLISCILRYRTGLFSQKTDREKRGEEENVWRPSAPLLGHITASGDYTPIYLACSCSQYPPHADNPVYRVLHIAWTMLLIYLVNVAEF